MGPAPFAAMMLAGLGAEVICVDRPFSAPETEEAAHLEFLRRGRRSIAIDLKQPAGVELVARMSETADGFIEGFRPGVTERMGIGPETLLARNPALVYGRMTGWGHGGPYSNRAGHDLNYIAVTGALNAIGRAGGAPAPPLALVGDFGGGGMLMSLGMVAAIFEARSSGKGQVIDAAVVDGAALLATHFYSGAMPYPRGQNLADSGAHFYDTYETKDGLYVSLGAIEERFYLEFLRLAELESEDIPHTMDHTQWPILKEKIALRIAMKTRDEWCEIMADSDACFAPVLTWNEAMDNEHNVQRQTYVTVAGHRQPAPGPRFSRTTLSSPTPSPVVGVDGLDILSEHGYSTDEIRELFELNIVSR
jgi:alpha-methylacyl-CoA racemase